MDFFSRSAVEYVLKPIDCRQLTLFMNYYFLSQDAVSAMICDILQWIQEIAEDYCAFRWYHNGKVCGHKRAMTTTYWTIPEITGLRIGFDGYVKSSVIPDSSAIGKYQKNILMRYGEYRKNTNICPYASESSVDFPAFFDDHFPNRRPENSQIVNDILEVFYEKDRKLMSFHKEPDISGHISANNYQAHPSQYYGTVSISFSAFCLDASLDNMSKALTRLACSLCETYRNCNVQVLLQPKTLPGCDSASPYMRYFGKHFRNDRSSEDARCEPEEWYPTYYLCGVEWFNILSPLARQHLKEDSNTGSGVDVEVRTLSSGGLLVKSAKPITAYAVEDALVLKQLVHPALYPGKCSIPLRGIYPWIGTSRIYAWCPRNSWEIVPVEKNEVDIVGTDIVFCSRNYIL